METDGRVIDIDTAIDSRPLSVYQMAVVCMCSATVIFDGFNNQTIGVLAPSIAKDLHVGVVHFGVVFSAGLFGWMIGALSMGPIADRFGRRWMIILSVMTYGVFALLTTQARSLNELAGLWFCGGLGLGGAVPNALALGTEFVPARVESRVAAWIIVGMPIGAMLGGLTSTLLLPVASWRAVLYIGGTVPLLLAVCLMIWLPESPRFLIAIGADSGRVKRIMQRVVGIDADEVAHFRSARGAAKGVPMRELFTEGRAADTLLFWVAFFGNLLILYFVINWFPAMLQGAGMTMRTAIIATSCYSLGGALGAVAAGYVLDAFGRRRTPIVLLLSSIVLIGVFANAHTVLWFTCTIAAAIGIGVQGSQTCLNALAAGYYPTSVRSTGLGWALGIGRIGAIVGPLLGEWMLSMHWTLQQIFMSAMIPSLIAALALGGVAWRHQRRQLAIGASHLV